ncbi:MAG: hypothetical protein KKH04_01260 [Proteobacteria bacterium]|nr:hypothetical protein [Pseudomonadota bacterium]
MQVIWWSKVLLTDGRDDAAIAVVLAGVMAGQTWAATVIRLGHVAYPGSLIAGTA